MPEKHTEVNFEINIKNILLTYEQSEHLASIQRENPF